MVPHRPPPPEGPPWDLPVGEAPLAFVDLEMTGLDAENDHVVEICVERWTGARKDGEVTTLVRPPRRAGGAAHVHGIDAQALEGAPSFASLAAAVAGVCEGAAIVAHAAEWDVRFLAAEMGRAGVPWEAPHYLDTLVLARRAFMFH